MITPGLGRLLIVDDEEGLLKTLCGALAGKGYVTVGRTSGQEALRALEESEFDLLLTDLVMPGMDGMSLLRAALKIDPATVIIIMTGQGTLETAIEAMTAGAFDFIVKPFKLNGLLPVLSRAMTVSTLRKENVELKGTLAIYELTKAVTVTVDSGTIASLVAQASLEQCRADEVSVMLPTDDGEELYIAAVRGQDREGILGKRIKVGEGIAGWVAKHREPVGLAGEVRDPRFSPIRPRSEIAHGVSIPMMAGGRFVGVVNVNALRRSSFTLGQIKGLTITVGIAAPSLENARLYELVQTAENGYEGVFQNALEGILQTTVGGRIIRANPALAVMLGYGSPGELIDAVAHEADRFFADAEEYRELTRHLEESGTVRSLNVGLIRKGGDTLMASVKARAVADGRDKVTHHELYVLHS